MGLIGMTALRDFTHDGVSYVRGEMFQVGPVHAAVLQFAQHARFSEPTEQPEPPPFVEAKAMMVEKPITVKPTRKRRKYTRRDIKPSMTA